MLATAIGVILGLAVVALGLIMHGYIHENERALFVMRAFGHRYDGLFLLLLLQITVVTLLMFGIVAITLYTVDLLVAPYAALLFGLPTTQVVFTVAKMVYPSLMV